MDTLLLQRSLHLFERQREREAERAGREEEIFTHMQRIAKQPPRNSDGEAKRTSVGGVCCVMYPSASSLSLSPQCCNRCGGCVASDRQPKQASDYVEEKEKTRVFATLRNNQLPLEESPAAHHAPTVLLKGSRW